MEGTKGTHSKNVIISLSFGFPNGKNEGSNRLTSKSITNLVTNLDSVRFLRVNSWPVSIITLAYVWVYHLFGFE